MPIAISLVTGHAFGLSLAALYLLIYGDRDDRRRVADLKIADYLYKGYYVHLSAVPGFTMELEIEQTGKVTQELMESLRPLDAEARTHNEALLLNKILEMAPLRSEIKFPADIQRKFARWEFEPVRTAFGPQRQQLK